MAGFPWFKFYAQDFLTDPKMMRLTVEERMCWVILMCLASSEEKEGDIPFADEHEVMRMAGINFGSDGWDSTVGFFEKFALMGLIQIDNVINDNAMITSQRFMITLPHFKDRQEENLTGYERVKRYREKRKNNTLANSSHVINDNARGEGDKRKSKEQIPMCITTTSGNDKGESVRGGGENPFEVGEEVISGGGFDELWDRYPSRKGRKEAARHYAATVRSQADVDAIGAALENYLRSGNVARGFIQNGSTWFNNWRDWVNPTDFMMKGGQNGAGKANLSSQERRAGFKHGPEDERRFRELKESLDLADRRRERSGPD